MEKELSKNGLIKIAEGTYFGRDSGILLEAIDKTKNYNYPYEQDRLRVSDDVFNYQKNLAFKYAPWGISNDFPQEVMEAVIENSITPGIINLKSTLNIAKGIYAYTEIIEGNKKIKIPIIDLDLEQWLEEIEITKYLRSASMDCEYFRNIFTDFIFSRDMKRINGISRIDATNCRTAEDGKSIFVYDTWNEVYTNTPKYQIPLFDKNRTQTKFATHEKNFFPGAGKYGVASWIGSLNWIKMANEVAKFKLSSIKNGFSIKYHIKYPRDYFDMAYPDNKINPETGLNYTFKDRKEKESELITQMNQYLSGSRNAGKTFFSKFGIGRDGKSLPGWEIDVLEDNVKYDAYLDDVNTSTGQIVSAQNVHPSIANILIEGKLSSGSDLRNAFNIYVQMMTQEPREMMLNNINLAKRLTFPNKRNIKLGFEDVELATMDITKSGVIQTPNQNADNI